jgi:hypothetical protein
MSTKEQAEAHEWLEEKRTLVESYADLIRDAGAATRKTSR